MSDDLNPDVRRLVELARKARTPGEDDKLRLAERLAVPLAAGAALGSAAGAAKAATGASLFAGLGAKVAAVVALSAVAAAVVVTKLESKPTPQAPSAQVEKTKPAPPSAEIAEALPTPSAAPEPLPSEPAVPQKAAPSGAHTATPAHELEEEAALLHQAQSAWRTGQSAQALQLANQHAQRFPHSQLANERDVLRVLSLCKLGQVHAAKQVGARLLRTAKGSPWYQSVAESCAGQ
jgi:type IV secretory pathway VirB10-like protein